MTRKWVNRTINVIFIVVLLLLVFKPGAKAWMLKQLLVIGFFKADAAKHAATAITPVSINLTDHTGTTISTASLKGKTLFINFWASWCPPCRAEMAGLFQLTKELENSNDVVFIFVNEDEDKAKAMQYLDENDFDLPIYKLQEIPPVSVYSGTLPTTIVIDKQGDLVYKHDGIANYNTEAFQQFLRSL